MSAEFMLAFESNQGHAIAFLLDLENQNLPDKVA